MKFRSTKVLDGFSTCFRQHVAEGTHCRFLHGYAISFQLVFEGELDSRNWVVDFGGFKRAKEKIDGMNPKEWFSYMFDHTVVLSEDDPLRESLESIESHGGCQLRTLPSVGCEKFAEYVYNKVNEWLLLEFNGRVSLISVECREHSKNSAIYSV